MHNTRPGIVIKVRFVDASAGAYTKGVKVFAGYIDYIDRSEAVRTRHVRDFSLYTDYMDNPEKQRNLPARPAGRWGTIRIRKGNACIFKQKEIRAAEVPP